MQEFEINAQPREDKGKGASRRLRRTGKVPGIIYGAKQDALSISLEHDELVHQLEHEAFFSHILTLNLAGKSEKVVLKDLQRHPYKPKLTHIDFQRVDEKQKLTMRVPIHFINEAKCIGVKTGGGVISHIMTELEITCLPKDLPEFIEVDLQNLDVGDVVHLGDVQIPEGVEINALLHGGDPAQSIASVHIPRVEEEIEEAAELEEGLAAAEVIEQPPAEQSSDED